MQSGHALELVLHIRLCFQYRYPTCMAHQDLKRRECRRPLLKSSVTLVAEVNCVMYSNKFVQRLPVYHACLSFFYSA